MADGKTMKALRQIVEGEHLAANALTVAIGKVKETDLQQLLDQLRNEHETNAEEAGQRLVSLGGQYPIPGLRQQLKKGWEAVASTKTSADALKFLQKKETEALSGYKDLLKKVGDEQTMNVVLQNMADTTENVIKLREKLGQIQGKKQGGAKLLGLPLPLWLIAAAGGGAYYYYTQRSKDGGVSEPITPASNNS